MFLKTQEQIMQNWKAMKVPLVSIRCITYNQERYIAQALDGFLMQETNFPFEVTTFLIVSSLISGSTSMSLSTFAASLSLLFP